MKKTFIEKIKNQTPAIGTIVTLSSPEVAEILSLEAYDWLFIDMEHASLSFGEAQHILQAIKDDCSGIIRIPDKNSVWIKKALDTGCDGIIVPQITSAEDAKLVVAAAKYSPQGARSVGISRAQGYGRTFNDYVKTANEHIALIIQIEHIEAVHNLDEILEVKGIDGVLIGPYDLSESMNVLGDITNPKVQEAIQIIKEKCKEHSIPFGIFVMKPEAVKKEIDDGYSFIAVGIDTVMLGNAVRTSLEMIKNN